MTRLQLIFRHFILLNQEADIVNLGTENSQRFGEAPFSILLELVLYFVWL